MLLLNNFELTLPLTNLLHIPTQQINGTNNTVIGQTGMYMCDWFILHAFLYLHLNFSLFLSLPLSYRYRSRSLNGSLAQSLGHVRSFYFLLYKCTSDIIFHGEVTTSIAI